MNQLVIDAKTENLPQLLEFIDEALTRKGYGPQLQIELAVEEIFVNIASYAYAPDVGSVTVELSVDDSATLTFIDEGRKYNPLLRDDPDFEIPLTDREPGGLGVFMVKNIMDETAYEYTDGKNILTIKKTLM